MVQIRPPTPAFLRRDRRPGGAGNYWQNTDYYNTQFKILTSKTLGRRSWSA
jgi:hypothetical protein